MLGLLLTFSSSQVPASSPPRILTASMEGEAEANLARCALAGNVEAFSILVQKYQGMVYRLCRRYLSTIDAEDVAQETFIRAFVHRSHFDGTRPIGPWLATIARHLCIDYQRKYSVRKSEQESVELLDPKADLEGVLISREELVRVSSCLQALPEGQREALVFFYVEGMSYAEIAAALDVPVGTVMTWLHRGKARLISSMQSPKSSGEQKS